MSTAQAVRVHVADTPVRRFIWPARLDGSRRAIEVEMSRLAAEGEVIRVRKGLYWKGPKTRVGMPFPRPLDLGLEVAGPGSGPAGVSAAHLLGLTTQVPAVEQVAVPGRVPAPVPGVRFVSRSIERRIGGLRPVEVALIEVLRDGPTLIEQPWTHVSTVVEQLVDAGEVRPGVIATQVGHEHHVAARQRWNDLGITEAAR
jgi:hypothetical protein